MNPRRLILLVVLTAVLVPAGATAEDGKPPRVTLVAEDVDIRVALATIAKEAGGNVIVDPKIAGRVTVSLRDVPWTEAVEAVAMLVGAAVVKVVDGETATVMRVVPEPEKAQMHLDGLTVEYVPGKVEYRYHALGAKDGKFKIEGLVPGRVATSTGDSILADLRAAVPKLRAAGLEKEARAVEQEIARREKQLTSPGEARLLAEVQALRRDVASLRKEIRELTAIVRGEAGAAGDGEAGSATWPKKSK